MLYWITDLMENRGKKIEKGINDSMKKRLLAVLFAALIGLSMTACGKTGNDAGNASGIQNQMGNTEEDDGVQQAGGMDQALYNAYIDVSNVMVSEIPNAMSGYFKDVEAQETFVLLDQNYFNYIVPQYVTDVLETANNLLADKSEQTDLDEAFVKVYPVMKKLIEINNEIEEYTDMKAYVDDDYAKGRELHAQFWKTLEEYEPLQQAFQDQFKIITDEQEAKDRQRMQDEGLMALYQMNLIIDAGQALAWSIYDQEVYDENVIALKIADLQEQYDALVEAIDGGMEVLADEEQLASEGLNGAYVEGFISRMKDVKVNAVELWQRVKDQEPIAAYELGLSIAADGSIRKLEESISALVDAYNQIVSN